VDSDTARDPIETTKPKKMDVDRAKAVAKTEAGDDWAAVQKALHDCEKVVGPPGSKEQAENVIAKLMEFSNQANAWVKRRRASTNDAEAQRVDAAIELSNWASREAAETSKYLAELIYLDDVIQSENSKYPFQAITKKSVDRVKDKVVGKPSRLTEAQSAAFRIFTGGDYAYINPAMAADPTWLAGNKAKYTPGGGEYENTGLAAGFLEPRGEAPSDSDAMDKHRMSEGAVHAAMLDRAIQKLPVYTEKVFRGANLSQIELDDLLKTNTVVFPTMTSTSMKRDTPQEFINEKLDKPDKDRPILVMYTITNSGGRAISEFSAYEREEEVMVVAGTTFKVTKAEKEKGVWEIALSGA
jgi:hypothetical protein